MINFPDSPTVGQAFTSGPQSWTWDGKKWLATGTAVQPPLSTGSNRIINGDFLVNQYGSSGTLTGITADRWKLGMSVAGKMNWATSNSVAGTPNGFPRCMSITSLSAYTAAAADSFCYFQPIEANMVNDFAWGTPGAQPVTLSFWVNVSAQGTYSGCISNYGPPVNRCYPFTFSVSAGWSKVVVTIPGDTGGTWVNAGNGGSVYVTFDLGSGSSVRSAVPNQWQNGNVNGVAGAAGIVATNGAIFQLSGVKLEIGNVPTPFNRETPGKVLRDCQRYYQTANTFIGGYNVAPGVMWSSYYFPVQMRVAPTVAFTNSSVSNMGAISLNNAQPNSITVQATITATGGGWSSSTATFNSEI